MSRSADSPPLMAAGPLAPAVLTGRSEPASISIPVIPTSQGG